MRYRTAALAFCLTSTLALAACANSNDAGAPAAAPVSGSTSAPPVSNSYALHYTGGKPRAADRAQKPVVIGYVNQEGGVPSFPEATQGLEAAVKYVNSELDGVQGHPVTISKCLVQTAADAQKCGAELANNPAVDIVLIGQLAVGNSALYAALAEKQIPTIQASPGPVADLTAKNSYAYTAGGPGLLAGLGLFIAHQFKGVGKVGVLYADNPAGQASATQFFEPLLTKLGVKSVSAQPIADDATGPTLASAIQALGLHSSTDVLVSFLTPPGCIATYDGLRSLDIHPRVVATGLCFDTSVTQHLHDLGAPGQVPDWYYGQFGYSYFQPVADGATSGMSTYLAKIRQYAGASVNYTGFAGYVFADLLTTVKFMNTIGAAHLSPQTLRQQAAAFTGPMMLTPGAQHCGFSKMFAALCGTKVGVEQYAGSTWHPTALGDKSIDIASVLGG